MNNYTCIANLTRDPELRYTPNGKAVINLGLALNDGYGEKKQTYFINCVAWDKVAENCNKYLYKGAKVGIVGKLTQRSYENKDGKNVSVIEVLAFNVEFLSAPKEQAPVAEAQAVPAEIEEEIIIPGEEEMF